jgi:hypothetical protein
MTMDKQCHYGSLLGQPLMSRSRLLLASNRWSDLVLVTLVSLVASSFLFGCGAGGSRIRHEHSISPGQGYHEGLTKVLLAPLNQALGRPPGLDVADVALMRLVTDYLEAHGLVVETVSLTDYQRALEVAAREAQKKMLAGESGKVSSSIEFSDILPLMVEEFGSGAQLVVLPNVAMRSGAYSGGRAVRWDGVRRRERGARGGMSGSTEAASLYILIYRRDGSQIFSAYGGLDLLFELNMNEKKYVIREDRLQDEANLAEGVCISFHPFFGIDVDC